MRKNNYGFTLIEMLLGVIIFSIIAVTVYATFSSGMQLNRRAEHVNTIAREVRWVFDNLTEDLENARFYDFSKSYPDKIAFQGKSDRMDFLLAGPDGLRVVSYYLDEPDFGRVVKTVVGKRVKKLSSVLSNYTEKSNVRFLVRQEKLYTLGHSQKFSGKSSQGFL